MDLIELVEERLMYGPFAATQRVMYHGKLYGDISGLMGVILSVDEEDDGYARVDFDGRIHNCWLGNLKRVP